MMAEIQVNSLPMVVYIGRNYYVPVWTCVRLIGWEKYTIHQFNFPFILLHCLSISLWLLKMWKCACVRGYSLIRWILCVEVFVTTECLVWSKKNYGKHTRANGMGLLQLPDLAIQMTDPYMMSVKLKCRHQYPKTLANHKSSRSNIFLCYISNCLPDFWLFSLTFHPRQFVRYCQLILKSSIVEYINFSTLQTTASIFFVQHCVYITSNKSIQRVACSSCKWVELKLLKIYFHLGMYPTLKVDEERSHYLHTSIKWLRTKQ